MDPNLPFYYYTPNARIGEGFNEPVEVAENVEARRHPLRLHRIKPSRREDSSVLCARRAYLPQRGAHTMRHRFFSLETAEDLPLCHRIFYPMICNLMKLILFYCNVYLTI